MTECEKKFNSDETKINVKFCTDAEHTIIEADEKFYDIIGYNKNQFIELFKNQLIKIVYENDVQNFVEHSLKQTKYQSKYRIICADNKIKWIEENGELVENPDGSSIYCVKLMEIVGNKNPNKVKFQNNNNLYKFDNITNIAFEYNNANKILTVSKKMAEILNCDTLIYNFPFPIIMSNIIHPDDINEFCNIFFNYEKLPNSNNSEIRIKNANDDYNCFRCITKNIYAENSNLISIVGFMINIDDEKNEIINVYKKGSVDSLTGLYNKKIAKRKIDDEIIVNASNSAMMVINIDNFKVINNELGCIYGDAVISEMAGNLKKVFRTNDIIGRIGGDQFVVFITDIESVDNAKAKAEILMENFNEFLTQDGKAISLSASIGISFFRKDGENFDQLFEAANSALYYAKNHGKNRYCVYTNEIEKIFDSIPENIFEGSSGKNFRNNMPEYIMNFLQISNNIKKDIPIILDLIANATDSDRISIYERSEDALNLANTFERCSDKTKSVKNDELKSIYESFINFVPFDDSGMYLYNFDNEKNDSYLTKWFNKRDTKTALICSFKDNDKIQGVMMFERKHSNLDYVNNCTTLNMVGQVLLLYIMLENLNKQVKINNKYNEIFLKQTNILTCGIDAETFNINFVNSYSLDKNWNIKIGKPCYKQIRGCDKPCDDCPFKQLQNDDDVFTQEMYLNCIGKWAEVTASQITDENNKKSYAISLLDTTKFYNFKQESKKEITALYKSFMEKVLDQFDFIAASEYCSDDVKFTDQDLMICAQNKDEFIKFCQELKVKHSNLKKVKFNTKRMFINTYNKNQGIIYATINLAVDGSNSKCTEIKYIINTEKIDNVYKITNCNFCILNNEGCKKTDVLSYENAVKENQTMALINQKKDAFLGLYIEENLPIYFINDEMLELLGYCSNEEFQKDNGNNFENVVYKKQRYGFVTSITEQCDVSGKIVYDLHLYKKDNTLVWIRIKGNPFLTIDNRKVIMGICQDITEIKDLESQLEIYRNSSRGGTFIISEDEDLTLLYANDILCNMFGYKKEVFAEKYCNKCSKIVESIDLKEIKKIIKHSKNIGKNTFETKVKIKCNDGSIKTVHLSAAFRNQNNAGVLCGFIIDITEQEKLIDEIERSEARYKIALNQTKICIWEYDIAAKKIQNTQGSMERHGFNYDLENVPEFLIMTGYVHPDCIEDYRLLYKKVQEGKERVTGEFRFQNNLGNGWWWEKITYTTIFDENKKPIRAIALGEDITEQKNAEIKYQEDIHAKNILAKGTLCSFKTNLATNEVQLLNIDESVKDSISECKLYADLLGQCKNIITNTEDKKRFVQLFNSKSLISQFNNGNEYVGLEYRKRDSTGKLRWVKMSSQLIKDAVSGELCAYSNIKDIHERKTLELSLRSRAEKDLLTGVYNRDTCNQMMKEALEKEYKVNGKSALMLINLDDFNSLVKDIGYYKSDDVLKELTDIITSKIGAKPIIGRSYGDEFMVLIQEVASDNAVKCMAEEIRKAVNMPYMFKNLQKLISVSIGISITTEKKESFRIIYEQAKAAVDLAKASGKNKCVLYSYDCQNYDFNQNLSMYSSSNLNCMSTGEIENIILKSGLMASNTLNTKSTVNVILKNIVEYYSAERAFIIEFGANDNKYKKTYCFDNTNEEYIQENDGEFFNELYDDLLPIFCEHNQYMIEDIEKVRKLYPSEYNSLKSRNVKNCSVTACIYRNKPICYLIVENITTNLENTVLTNTLSNVLRYILSSEQAIENEKFLMSHDLMTGLYNRNYYTQYIANLREESLISIGILCADINGLKKINENVGVEYGDNIIKATAEELKDVFGEYDIFSLSGGMYQVVCQDISQEGFANLIKEIKNKQKHNNLSALTIGFAWSDTDMQLDSLVKHAEEKMQIEKKNYNIVGNSANCQNLEFIDRIKKEIGDGNFYVYLQPKARMCDNKISGAEALIRYETKETGLVFPDRFIPKMERAGLIKYIDLFVFEQICDLIKKWIKADLEPITISLNFSRQTILDDDIIETMENIYNKYSIPKKYLEIEVTESLGDVERQTLVNIGQKIVDNGYRISIDDFGSKFSNMSIVSAMNLSAVKLDKSLVNDLFSNIKSRIVVGNFIATCKELGIESVAEGVEIIEQLEILKELKCDYVQGYYFNKPIPIEKFETLYIKKIIKIPNTINANTL
ncbi:MAG: diguanylate cyclase [Oscillospiraceae bacterium]